MLWVFIVLVIMDLASASVSIPAWAYLTYLLASLTFLAINAILASR